MPGSERKVWWTCPKGPDHVWQNNVQNRAVLGEGCPFSIGKRPSVTNSLRTVAPEIAAEWHPTKNTPLTPDLVTTGTIRMVWWRCAEGHEWRTGVSGRVRGQTACPYCSGHKATPETCLAARFPELAEQWHPTKNGALTPYDVLPRAGGEAWWKCAKGDDHEWQSTIDSRTGRAGLTSCPFCANRRLSITNSLATRYPSVAAQWHPTRNGSLTPADVIATRTEHAWWRCPVGHEWRAGVYPRTQLGTGCPHCTRRKQRPAMTTRVTRRRRAPRPS